MKKIKHHSKPHHVDNSTWEHYLLNVFIVDEEDWKKLKTLKPAKTPKAKS
jgi:hypothetical protein